MAPKTQAYLIRSCRYLSLALPPPFFHLPALHSQRRRLALLCVRALTSRLRTRGAQAATHHVALPSERYESYNVAMAGSIVMYDRIAKLRRGEHL